MGFDIGTFRLYTSQFLFISAFVLLTYGIDIVLLNIFRSQDINLKIECFHWFGLAIVLISVSFIGGNISSIRRELRVSRKKLQSSLTVIWEMLKVIQEMAIHDDLTGFYNRPHLMYLIESEINRSMLNGTIFYLAMVDIDKFKNINDTYGHQIGDQVLRTFAAVIRSVLCKTDFCGRYGGDEFLIVLTQTDLQAAKVFAERIRESVENSFFPDLGLMPELRFPLAWQNIEYMKKLKERFSAQMKPCTKPKMGDATAWNAPTKDKDTTIQMVNLNSSDECQMLWSSR